ncbi:MAG: DUF4062 domain-containing protein, partial [Muribaculaceae bacterium]|nr:DUF4062 domain-containing protein [Muribaculaceae bacterium]
MTGAKTNPVAREIRVFISSTFRDMQAERDHLINRVFPALSREAERRNVTILPVDLRWGITEEEASQGSVVGICLEQIDQSRPFFIGLIGHRDGLCSGYADVASASARCARLGMYVDHGLSMTEIEMQYGVLDSDSDTDALFMIKADQPGCVPDPGILRLRDKVSLRRPSDTVTYSSVEQLGECVRQRMIELLDRYYPATEQSMETAVSDIMWGQAEKEASVYIDQYSLTEAPLSNHLVRVYQAPPGEGRSAYVASRAVTLREDSGLAVVYFRTGNDTAVENKNKFLTVLRHQLAVAAGVNDDPVLQRLGFADVVEYLCSRLKSCGRTPVFIIDGAECMQYISAFEWRRELLLPLVANGCYVEITLPVGESFRAIRELFMYPYQDMRAELIEIPVLSPESRCRYISMHLAKFGKRLPSQIVEYLAAKPITMRELRFVLDEMLVYGVFETLPNYIDRLLALESMSDRYMHVLHRITGMIPVAEISPLLAVLAVACHGVPEFELWHDILHWTPLRWAEVYGLMRNIISRSSTGLVADLDLKDLLKSITTADDRQVASVAIAAALDGKHKHDAECAVQLYRSGQHDKLWSLLANDGATLNILSAGDDHTPYTYWNFLLHKDPYKYSFTPVSESAYNVSQALTLLKFNHNYFRNAEFVLEIYNRFDRDLFETDDVDIWNYLLEIMPVPSRIDWLESIAVGRSIPAKNMLAAHYIDAGKMDVAADWIEKAIDDWRFVSVSDRYRSMYLADGVNMYLTRAYMWFRFGKIDKARADLDAADALAPRVCADTLSHSRAVAARCVIDFLWAYREGMD